MSQPQPSTPRGLTLRTPCTDQAHIRTIIAGHSHAIAVIRALTEAGDAAAPLPGPALALRHGFAGLASPSLDTHAGLQALADLAPGRNIALVWRGNQANRAFLFHDGSTPDVIPRSDPDCPVDPQATLLPESMVRAHYWVNLQNLDALLGMFATASVGRRFVLGTPPPLYGEAQLRQRLRSERYFIEKAAEQGLAFETLPITPGAIRRKFWQVLQDQMRDIAQVHGATFVPVPPDACDEHGCMRPVYSSGNVAHANYRYGGLMLRELAAAIDRAP